jgi:hypothetical protein
MIVQVLPDTRLIHGDRNAKLAQMIGGAYAGQHQELGRHQAAGAQDHFLGGGDAFHSARQRDHDAAAIAALDVELDHRRAGQQRQVRALERRNEIAVRGRHAAYLRIGVDVLLPGRIADMRDVVHVAVLGLAAGHRRLDERSRHRMRFVAGTRGDHARAAAHRACAAGKPLGLLEIADDVLEAPARTRRLLPRVVVGLVAVQPDRGVDAGAAADDPADRRRDAAAVEMRLRR